MLLRIPTMNDNVGPRTYLYSDFYKAMNEVANKTGYLPAGTTLSQVADPWIDHDRLPLVTVKRDYDTGTINITQVTSKIFLQRISIVPLAHSILTF